jgi:hypothetical protein
MTLKVWCLATAAAVFAVVAVAWVRAQRATLRRSELEMYRRGWEGAMAIYAPDQDPPDHIGMVS